MDLGVQTEETWLESLAGKNRWVYCCSWGTTREGECFLRAIYIVWRSKTGKLFGPDTYLIIFRRGKKERPMQQKMDGRLWCITRGGKRPLMLKLEQLLALYLLLQCKRKWLTRNPRKLIWTSTDFRNEKPTSVVCHHCLSRLLICCYSTPWLLHMIELRPYIAQQELLGLVSCNVMQFMSHDKI